MAAADPGEERKKEEKGEGEDSDERLVKKVVELKVHCTCTCIYMFTVVTCHKSHVFVQVCVEGLLANMLVLQSSRQLQMYMYMYVSL